MNEIYLIDSRYYYLENSNMIVADKVESESASVTNDELNMLLDWQIEGKLQVVLQMLDGIWT